MATQEADVLLLPINDALAMPVENLLSSLMWDRELQSMKRARRIYRAFSRRPPGTPLSTLITAGEACLRGKGRGITGGRSRWLSGSPLVYPLGRLLAHIMPNFRGFHFNLSGQVDPGGLPLIRVIFRFFGGGLQQLKALCAYVAAAQ